MEILLILASVCLVLFIIWATFDGFYLHIFTSGLFNHEESTFEHKTHTVRAVLFPLIVWCLFVNEASFGLFLMGIWLVVVDLVVLGIDAYSETESRKFMGGLPKWEYLIYLFSNSLHFAAIILVFAMKIDMVNGGLVFGNAILASFAKEVFIFVSVNLIPSVILLALLHFILLVERPRVVWNTYPSKINCC